jgi:paraquat-inducible protein B
MTQENHTEDKSTPIITRKSRISVIWVLPLIAALIGAAMVYQQWQNRGVEIVIEFESAKGLEAKKTKVKFRNVDIGTVQDIRFATDTNSIEATVEIDKSMEGFLKSDSQFWVVRPRIGSSGVSGFSTLLSGAYITLDAGKSDFYASRFVGLENPPISSPTDEGIKLHLVSSGGEALAAGNPVVYRGFEVGAVEDVLFDVDTRSVTYSVFVRSPYDALITSNTYFWNASGVNVSATTEGINVDFASLESILSGGVQFDVPEDLELGERITETQEFTLYESRASINDDRAYDYLEYVILVEDTVSGLQKGAAVEYRGIRIGRVHRPYIGFYQLQQIDPDEIRIPVIIHVEPTRLAPGGEYDVTWFDNQFNEWIRTGLAASVETANYLTGSLKISLDSDNNSQNEIEYFGPYKVIPISESGFASILSKTEQLLTKLERLPLDELIQSTNQAVTSANTTIMTANDAILSTQAVLMSVEETLQEANTTLQGLQPDSSMYNKLESNLQELERTLNMMQPFLQEIRRKPNTLIFSDDPPADTQPKGKE